MTFTGEQVNTYGSAPSRLFLMDATMRGLPVDVLHVFVGRCATMRVKACSLVTMVDAAGPDMDRAETAPSFNDLAVLVPAAPLDSPHPSPPPLVTHVRAHPPAGAPPPCPAQPPHQPPRSWLLPPARHRLSSRPGPEVAAPAARLSTAWQRTVSSAR